MSALAERTARSTSARASRTRTGRRGDRGRAARRSATGATSTRRCRACRRCARRSPPTSAASTGSRSTRQTEVQVTFGATEAIAAALLGAVRARRRGRRFRAVLRLLRRGDRDGRRAAPPGRCARRTGRSTPTRSPPRSRRRRGAAAQLAAQPDRARCSPRRAGADRRALREHDLIAITDEVYEHLVFDGEHVPLATLPGMAERTLTISSLGKTFSVTGWKIGWATGRARSWPRCAPPSSS